MDCELENSETSLGKSLWQFGQPFFIQEMVKGCTGMSLSFIQ